MKVQEIQENIYQLIRQKNHSSAQFDEHTNLYKDLYFDSLSFISLIVDVENMFSIIFDITEMEACLVVGHLTDVVKEKIERV